MRKLDRPPAPACLAIDSEEQVQAHRDRYANVRYPGGAWRALWNDLDRDSEGIAAPRRALLAMSDGECAYCGLWVGNEQMKVDHILPKEVFPSIAYAWENLLPACDPCNRHKHDFVPASLQGKRVVEPCLRDTLEHDLLFEKARLFSEVAREDRLVDPSFDDPADHIELLLDIPSYRPKSAVGRLTERRLFRHREVTERLAKVREAARVVVEVELSAEQVHRMAIATMHPSLFYRFADYWRAEQREGRMPEWERAEAR